MAQVSVKIAGGSMQLKDAATIGELKNSLGLTNHSAAVNGEIEDDSYQLSEGEFITLSPQVKGGV